MYWQSAVLNPSAIDKSATQLLDALEVLRPCGERRMSPAALGRWLMEAGQDGTISDDTVVWLHHLLLPTGQHPRPTAIDQRRTTGRQQIAA